MILEIALVSSTLLNGCNRGCNYENGDCWKILADVYLDGVCQTPTRVYVGEPYPTEDDAKCGAVEIRRVGVCLGLVNTNANFSAGKLEFILDGPTAPDFPGTDDCFYSQTGEKK